jgi:hypothetical protein
MLDNTREAWTCKIGSVKGVQIPLGADAPMRAAIRKAFKEVTGEDAEAIFSGWGSKFNEAELHVIDPDVYPAPKGD